MVGINSEGGIRPGTAGVLVGLKPGPVGVDLNNVTERSNAPLHAYRQTFAGILFNNDVTLPSSIKAGKRPIIYTSSEREPIELPANIQQLVNNKYGSGSSVKLAYFFEDQVMIGIDSNGTASSIAFVLEPPRIAIYDDSLSNPALEKNNIKAREILKLSPDNQMLGELTQLLLSISKRQGAAIAIPLNHKPGEPVTVVLDDYISSSHVNLSTETKDRISRNPNSTWTYQQIFNEILLREEKTLPESITTGKRSCIINTYSREEEPIELPGNIQQLVIDKCGEGSSVRSVSFAKDRVVLETDFYEITLSRIIFDLKNFKIVITNGSLSEELNLPSNDPMLGELYELLLSISNRQSGATIAIPISQ